MRKSTLARLTLLCYGLNCTATILALMLRQWGMMVFGGVFVAYCSWWFESNYFDKGEGNED